MSPLNSTFQRCRTRAGMLAVVFGLTCLSHAQNYSVDWYSIDGGGGTSSGGPYTLSGTIGQPDAGPTLTGGPYSLTGGFWSIIAAIQTPGAPLLSIQQDTVTTSVTISWPLPATDFVLEQSATIDVLPATWIQVPFPYQTNATDIFVTVPSPTGTRFYRLNKP